MNTEEIENYKVLLKYLLEMKRKNKKEKTINTNIKTTKNNSFYNESNGPIIATITNEGIIGVYTGEKKRKNR